MAHNLSKTVIPIAVILAIVIAGLFFIKKSLPPSGAPNGERLAIQTGAVLPDFELADLHGKTLKVSEILKQKKIVLINFWATWCDSCIHEMPSLVKLHLEYRNQGFEILGINVDENPESLVPQTVRKFGIEFSNYKDREGTLADLLDVHAIPLSVVINQERKILFIETGEKNWFSKEFRNQLELWLNNG